ncbi:MAG: GNAT family N-acetyltransferase [Chitinophagaceae bacterium]
MESSITIRTFFDQDWPFLATIYQQGIQTGQATFQSVAPTWEQWDRSHIQCCRLVGEMEGIRVGWAALAPVSGREVYSGVGEVSIYVGTAFQRKGIGRILLGELIRQSEACGFWTLQSGIFPENIASIALHEKLGFRMVGYREKIGQLKGVWRNTVLLERRSSLF